MGDEENQSPIPHPSSPLVLHNSSRKVLLPSVPWVHGGMTDSGLSWRGDTSMSQGRVSRAGAPAAVAAPTFRALVTSSVLTPGDGRDPLENEASDRLAAHCTARATPPGRAGLGRPALVR